MPDFQQITLSVLAVIIILDKFGILDKLPFVKNGKNGNGEKKAGDIAEILATNHLHKVIENSDKTILLLEQIRDEVKEHSRTETPILQDISKGITYLEAKSNHIKHE